MLRPFRILLSVTAVLTAGVPGLARAQEQEVQINGSNTMGVFMYDPGDYVLFNTNPMYAGNRGAQVGRSVARFDVSSIPAGATVTSVVAHIHYSKRDPGNATVSINRMSGPIASGPPFVQTMYDDAGDEPLATFVSSPTVPIVSPGAIDLGDQAAEDMTAALAGGIYAIAFSADGQSVTDMQGAATYLVVKYAPDADGDDNGFADRLEAARDRLYDLSCGSERAKKSLLKGRRLIADILVPRLWTDALHPDEDRGNAVFENAKQAVKALLPLMDAPCGGTVRTALDDLVETLGVVADTAYSDAVEFCDMSPRRSCSPDRKLGAVRQSVDNGDQHAANGRWFDAIRSYQEAWTRALEFFAKKRTVELSGIGVEDAAADEFTEQILPTKFTLDGNYPNPFNPVTTIRFEMPEAAPVHLSVFDVMGRKVRVLVQGTLEAGRHEASFDGAGLPSGTYLYRLTTPAGVYSKTMVLLK